MFPLIVNQIHSIKINPSRFNMVSINYFFWKSHREDETWLQIFENVSNCGKVICNSFGWDTLKIGVIRVKIQFGVWIQKDGLIENFFYMRDVKNLLKYNQALSKSVKKSSLFCVWKYLCLVDLRICVCLNKAKPWLELSIKFNWYSMRLFHWKNSVVFECI